METKNIVDNEEKALRYLLKEIGEAELNDVGNERSVGLFDFDCIVGEVILFVCGQIEVLGGETKSTYLQPSEFNESGISIGYLEINAMYEGEDCLFNYNGESQESLIKRIKKEVASGFY